MNNPITPFVMKQFRKFFGRPVQDFMCPVTGFDVIKFDEWAGTPDGVSCRDHIEKKFGKGSASIIETLIKVEVKS
jgi:hypothetical protein